MHKFANVLTVTALTLICHTASAARFCVAPSGSDDNPGTAEKPFQTLDRARQAVRKINAKMTGDIEVVLRGGTYRIARTVVFEPEDSGTGGHNVVYRAQAGETPIISGGRVVTGWKRHDGGIWKAPSPVADTRQLYVGGKRAVRARGPAPAGLELLGNDGYRTSDRTVLQWANVEDVEFCYLVTWTHSRCKVALVQPDPKEKTGAVIKMQQPTFEMARTKEGVQVSTPKYVENARELLDEAGEWYLDRPARTLHYKPRPGEDPSEFQAVAAGLETLVEIRGSIEKPVRNVAFRKITFADATWLQPSRIGHADVQANFLNDPAKLLKRGGKVTTIHNEQLKSPANVICRHAHGVSFDRCTFTRLGGAGLDIEQGSRRCNVTGCRFLDISGSAIQIGDVRKDDHHPADDRLTVRENVIRSCLIRDCCVDYEGGVGVFVGYTERTTVANNEIRDLPYSGVSVGWGWGEEDAGGGAYKVQGPFYDKPTACRENRITNNHIHHVMRELQDGGAIYTLGNQPGTIISGNHIHDNRGAPGGIYLDEGSGFIEITGNSVYNVPKPMNYNNHAQDRIKTCKEHDNFFSVKPGASGTLQIVIDAAGLEPPYRDLLGQPR